MVTEHHHPLAGIKLYCLVTAEAEVTEHLPSSYIPTESLDRKSNALNPLHHHHIVP